MTAQTDASSILDRAICWSATLCLSALALALPWEAFQFIPYTGITIVKLAGAAVVPLAALYWWRRPKTRFLRTGLEAPLLLFAAGCLISYLFSADPVASRGQLVVYGTYLAFFYGALVFIRRPEDGKILIGLYSLSACFTSAVTLACYSGWMWPALWGTASWPTQRLLLEYRDGLPMRMSGVAGDFNLAAMESLVALAALLFAFRGQKRGYALRAIGVSMLTASIAVTMSRSGLAIAGCLFATWILYAVPARLRLPALIACILVVAGFVFATRNSAYIETLLDRASGGVARDDGSINGRMRVYRDAATLLPRYILTGCGIGASDAVLAAAENSTHVEMTLHSTPFKITLETGILGAAGALWLVLRMLRISRRHLVLSGTPGSRALGQAFIATLLAIVAMLSVQPFPMLSLYPFLLAVSFGPVSHRDAVSAKGRHISAVATAVCGVTAVIVIQLLAYQGSAAAAIRYSDALEAGRNAELRAEWAAARTAYSEAQAEAMANDAPFRTYAEALVSLPTLYTEVGIPHPLDTQVAVATWALARTAVATGDLDTALQCLPGLPEDGLRFPLAEALWRQFRFEEALRLYEMSAEAPDSSFSAGRAAVMEIAARAEPSVERATALRQLGRWKEAVADFSALATIPGAEPEVFYNLAINAELQGERDDALAAYRKAATAGHYRANARLRILEPGNATMEN